MKRRRMRAEILRYAQNETPRRVALGLVTLSGAKGLCVLRARFFPARARR